MVSKVRFIQISEASKRLVFCSALITATLIGLDSQAHSQNPQFQTPNIPLPIAVKVPVVPNQYGVAQTAWVQTAIAQENSSLQASDPKWQHPPRDRRTQPVVEQSRLNPNTQRHAFVPPVHAAPARSVNSARPNQPALAGRYDSKSDGKAPTPTLASQSNSSVRTEQRPAEHAPKTRPTLQSRISEAFSIPAFRRNSKSRIQQSQKNQINRNQINRNQIGRVETVGQMPQDVRRIPSAYERPIGTGVQQAANQRQQAAPPKAEYRQVSMQQPIQDPFGDRIALPNPPTQRSQIQNSTRQANPVSVLNNDEVRPSREQLNFSSSSRVIQEQDSASSEPSTTPLANSVGNQDFQPNAQEQDDPVPNNLRENEQDMENIGVGEEDNSPLNKSCEDFRKMLLGNSIQDISLDMSPLRSSQQGLGIAEFRDWIVRSGQLVTSGTLIDLSRGYAIIQTVNGNRKLAYGRMSDADLAAVAGTWRIPIECTIGNRPYVARNFHPQTVTWKPSGLCHKPLYFENIQLERYGHSSGPFSQPVNSAVHFFVSFVSLPYQTAIHPPAECEYALGLYRPGDCAPWLKDPIPISLYGMQRQALVTTGLAFLP